MLDVTSNSIKDREMSQKEILKAQDSLEARYETLAKSYPLAHIFRKALEEYLEFLIAVRGHAWCMDVRSERKKMVRLIVGVCMNILALENKVDGSNGVSIRCRCRKDITLRLLGGQYQDSYAGRCTCGKGWLLTDLPAKLPFP